MQYAEPAQPMAQGADGEAAVAPPDVLQHTQQQQQDPLSHLSGIDFRQTVVSQFGSSA